MRYLSILFLTFLFFASNPTYSDTAYADQKQVRNFINHLVKEDKFNQQELTKLFNQTQYQPKIIDAMNKPYEQKDWDTYKSLFLTQKRLEEGLQFWKENQAILKKAEEKFHIPAQVIVAIIGVETSYGKHQGTHRVIDALSTLAFHYPRRAPYFKKELREFLILCRELKTSPLDFYGSYAGAMGTPQFMPSSYRHYAVDFTGNGMKDLINNKADAIGSVANYFKAHGWTNNDTVALPADVQGNPLRRIRVNNKKASYPLKELVSLGVKPRKEEATLPKKAGLIALQTKTGKEYWITFPNFYVITRYNSSPQYAMAVHLLSEDLKTHWDKSQNNTA